MAGEAPDRLAWVLSRSTIALIASRIDMSAGPEACWPWIGGTFRRGYGQFHFPRAMARQWDVRRSTGSHRLAWEIASGREIPPGLLVRHSCDNRPCCNPAHLSLGTDADNVRDAVERGRNPRGDSHGRRRLSSADVLAIIDRLTSGKESRKAIAREVGIAASAVDAIAWGKSWIDVPRPEGFSHGR